MKTAIPIIITIYGILLTPWTSNAEHKSNDLTNSILNLTKERNDEISSDTIPYYDDLGSVLADAEVNNPDAFITVWETFIDNETITIPTVGTGFNYSIDWGDMTTQSGLTGDATHTYATAGVYTVTITGDFPQMSLNENSSGVNLKEIQQWGNIQWKSFNAAFVDCINLQVTATDTPDSARLLV